MPIYQDTGTVPSMDQFKPLNLAPDAEEQDRPGVLELAASALRKSSDIVSIASSRLNGVDLYAPEEGFTGETMWNEVRGTKYEPHWPRLAPMQNRAAFAAMRDQIDMEDDDERTISAAGGMGIAASLGASLVSPITFIPGGAILKGARAGSTIAKTALAGGLAGGLATGVSELALGESQVTQDTNLPLAIGGGILFGSFVGAGVGALFSRSERIAAMKALEAAQSPDWDKTSTELTEELQGMVRSSLGAAATKSDTLDDLSIAGNAASKVAKATAQLNPLLRTLQSPSLTVRSIAAQMMDNPVYLKKNLAGEGDMAAETAMFEFTHGAVAQAIETQRAAYRDLRKLGNQMTDRQYRELAGQAMRRGDTSPFPEVAAAAKAWRKNVFDPLKDEAIKLGMLPKDVSPKTAVSYLTRMYNRPLIIAREQEFKGIIRQWVGGAVDKEMARTVGKSDFRFVNDAERKDYIDEIADEVFAKVTGQANTDPLPKDLVITKRGPLAERTLTIPDQRIEKFLEHDIELIGRRYARVMAADTELTRRFGSADMSEALSRIHDDYKQLRARTTDAKALADLAKREKADVGDLQGVRDILRGHYRPDVQHTNFARITNAAMTFNFIRALGGVTLSSLSDAVRPAMVHGMAVYMRDGIKPIVTNLNAVKMSAKEAKLAGAISERVLASRLATLAEITDPYSHASPFERFLENASVAFTKLTGILHWNDFQKTVSSVLTQTRILTNARKAAESGFDSLTASERQYMGFLGLGQGRAEALGNVFQTYGDDLDGVLVANTEAWPDEIRDLRRAYYGAINKDVNSIIVTKGAGDTPLLAHTPAGRAMLQFRTFMLASNQRVLIRGLQEDRSRFIGGMLGMAGIGMFISYLKTVEGGRVLSDNPGTWIAEGLDRSGIFSVGFEVNNAIEKFGGPGIYTGAAAIGRMVNPEADEGTTASRYQSRDTLGALFPMADLAQSTGGLVSLGLTNLNRTLHGEDMKITPGQIGNIRRMTPYASLPYWRWLIDGMLVPELKEAAQ